MRGQMPDIASVDDEAMMQLQVVGANNGRLPSTPTPQLHWPNIKCVPEQSSGPLPY